MRRAFTTIELIFVIVIIGILAAIALPKFSQTMTLAYDTSAKNTLAAVRSAIANERQKRILRGSVGSDIDYTFLGDAFSNVLSTGVKKCSDSGCGGWETTSTNNANPEFTFHSPDGDVVFKLENNKLVCTSSSDVCKKYDQ